LNRLPYFRGIERIAPRGGEKRKKKRKEKEAEKNSPHAFSSMYWLRPSGHMPREKGGEKKKKREKRQTE